MASVRIRNGRAIGLYRTRDGKQRSAGTYKTERDALNAAIAAEEMERRGRDGSAILETSKQEVVYPARKRGQLTVAGYAQTWLDGYALEKELEPTSRESYGFMLKHIVRGLGTVILADLDKARVKAFFAGLQRQGMSAATRGHVLTVLRAL
jgi:hypothetical protein